MVAPAPWRNCAGRGTTPVAPSLNIYSSGDKRLLLTITNLDELASANSGNMIPVRDPGLGMEKRIFLLPASDLLVTVSDTRDEIVMHKINLLAEMDKKGVDYLFVASLPIRAAHKGDVYQYAIDVKSKRGAVSFTLESGPDGMRVAPDGVVTWRVPLDGVKDAPVLIAIKDGSGQEIYHGFTIVVR